MRFLLSALIIGAAFPFVATAAITADNANLRTRTDLKIDGVFRNYLLPIDI